MKTFKSISELIDSLEISNIKQYLYDLDLVGGKLIVGSSDERAKIRIELPYKRLADELISVDNLKLRKFNKQLEIAELIHAMLGLAGEYSPIYEIWVLNGNSFNIRFKPEVTEGAVEVKVNSRMLVQFEGDNMNLTFNAIVNAYNGKDDLIDYVFNGDKKAIGIANLAVCEINDKIMTLYNCESESLKANVEIVKQLLNRELSNLTD